MSGGMEDWAEDDLQQRIKMQEELNQLRESLTHPTHYGDWVVGEFIHQRNMNFFQGNVVKYVDRYKKKDGLKDLKKAIDYLNKLIELEYGEKKT